MKLNNSMSDMYYINENFIEFFTEVTIFFYWFLLKRIYKSIDRETKNCGCGIIRIIIIHVFITLFDNIYKTYYFERTIYYKVHEVTFNKWVKKFVKKRSEVSS